jgi:hypothetical protein
MNQVSLHRDDLETILQFMKKYPTVDFMTISVDSSSGIGSIIKASINTIVNSDAVTITKTIMDESSW